MKIHNIIGYSKMRLERKKSETLKWMYGEDNKYGQSPWSRKKNPVPEFMLE